ncbi:MAG: hemolysin III family protein [Geothrix sp.]|nr:hemolysin III family protein [Geothrix sp.]
MKPRLRGLSHLVATCVAAPAAVVLWWGAGSWAARWGAAIYGLSLVMLLAMSATYHRPTWRPRARDWMGRLDQAAIFLLIAGTYTPFGLLLGPPGHLLLMLAWGAALGGVALSLLWPTAPKPLMAGIYVAFGWSFALLVPSLFRAAGVAVLGLIVAGAVAYTVGACIYALQRPDPFPRTFGYHEVFHLLVVVAAACHFAAVSLALPALG